MAVVRIIPAGLIGVGSDGNVGAWNNRFGDSSGTMANFGNLGGWTLRALAFDATGTAWATGMADNVGKWTGQGWENMGNLGGWTLKMVAFGPVSGNNKAGLWSVGTDGNVGIWRDDTRGWENRGNLGGWTLDMIAVRPDLAPFSDGSLWCVGTAGNVGRWNGNGWENKGNLGNWTLRMLMLVPGRDPLSDGGMWCVGTGGNVGRWNGRAWDSMTALRWNYAWISLPGA